jgi:hypothetical protein
MAEEAKKKYKVKPGMVFGHNPEYKAGEEVELTEKEAAGFLDILEPADAPKEAPKAEPPAVPKRSSAG